MGQRSKQTFLQRRHTDGEQTHEKMLNFTHYQRNAKSLLFNMLSRFVIAYLPRSKHLLILWLHSPFAVIFEPKKLKSATVYITSLLICHELMGPGEIDRTDTH